MQHNTAFAQCCTHKFEQGLVSKYSVPNHDYFTFLIQLPPPNAPEKATNDPKYLGLVPHVRETWMELVTPGPSAWPMFGYHEHLKSEPGGRRSVFPPLCVTLPFK